MWLRMAACWLWLSFGWGVLSPTALLIASESLPARQKWLQLVIRHGRIHAVVPKGHTATLVEDREQTSERLAVDYKCATLQLRYERTSPNSHLYCQFFDTDNLLLEHEQSTHSSCRLRLRQIPGQAIHIEYVDQSSQRSYQAMTIWHLCSLYPELGGELVACLQLLRPNWRLHEQLESLEYQLRTRQPACQVPTVLGLLEQLDADSFAEREAASRQIEAFGLAALPVLRQASNRQLTPEQRHRIDRICKRLLPLADDTPVQVAVLLLNDPDYWQQRRMLAGDADRPWAESYWRRLMGDLPLEPSRVAVDHRTGAEVNR